MFMFSRKQAEGPTGARGHRAYVVGDVHGRLDLLEALLGQIHGDMDRRGPRDTLLVFVGDLIDRGPSSAQVVERLRTYEHPGVRAVFLLGNHEEVLMRILDGDAGLIAKWLRFGGRECLQSYGVDPERVRRLPEKEALELVRAGIPHEHVAFIGSFADTCRFGDYLFVHAGIRPGLGIDEQSQSDLRWIREPFLFDDSDHGFVVVHGHTIHSRVEQRANRIAIDTGAYASGILSALGIEGLERWVLDTRACEGTAVSPTH